MLLDGARSSVALGLLIVETISVAPAEKSLMILDERNQFAPRKSPITLPFPLGEEGRQSNSPVLQESEGCATNIS